MSNVRPPGMCKDCRVKRGKRRSDGTVASRCAKCAVARAAKARVARRIAIKSGLCAYAGGCTAEVVDGRKMCAVHLWYYCCRPRQRS